MEIGEKIKAVRQMLLNGNIVSYNELRRLKGINYTRLASGIKRLKNECWAEAQGYFIKSKLITGNGVRYSEYWLVRA